MVRAMDAQHASRYRTALGQNLLSGYRLAAGRAVSADEFIFSLEQLIGLALVLFLLNVAASFLATSPPMAFNLNGLNNLGAIYLLSVLLVAVSARLAGADMASAGRMLIAYLAAKPVLFVASEICWALKGKASASADLSWLLYMFLQAWSSYVFVRLLLRFTSAPSPRLLGITIVYVLVCYASLWTFPRSTLWYTDKGTVRENPYAELFELNVEDTFYAQRQLMAEGIDLLAPQRPGVTDLYFLGVGGYGLEKVFLNEVEYVRALFDRQYGTAGRSMVLANNVVSVDRYPLANSHNLSEALTAIAMRMDPAEDVLFLFMTSHGSDKPRFSFEFGPVKLNDLSPQQLRQSLDDAGIRWRVIVISSCYSGGFVEPLKDPGTLIITAAAKDRQSFGCGASSDFTDFGTAYFKEALAQPVDFIQAFDLAAKWVADKEQRERREPSLPQRYVGEAIEARLTALTAQANKEAIAASETLPVNICTEQASQGRCR